MIKKLIVKNIPHETCIISVWHCIWYKHSVEFYSSSSFSFDIRSINTMVFVISLKFYSSSSFPFYITSCTLFNFVKSFTRFTVRCPRYHIQAPYRFILHRLHLFPVSMSGTITAPSSGIWILGHCPLSLSERRFNTRYTSPRLLSFICIQPSRVA